MFSFNSRYLTNIFYSIIPDIGAVGVSIVKKTLSLSSLVA